MTKDTTLTIIGFLTVWILTVEVLRYTSESFKNFLNSHISGIMRAHEHKRLFGSTWYLIGCFWTLLLFEPVIAIAYNLEALDGRLSFHSLSYFL